MNITNSETIFLDKIKEYSIELDNGKEIKLQKWWKESIHGGYESDYELDSESGEVFASLSDDEQDNLYDFIMDLD